MLTTVNDCLQPK